MLIISSTNPLSVSDGHLPLAIFCYENEKRFLTISETYEETIEKVVNSFRIQPGHSVLLQTSSFTACRGVPVVIDSCAYPLLWSLLEEVEVVVATEPVLEKDEAPKVDAVIHEAAKEQFTKATTTPSSPVAGPSRDGLGVQMPDVRRTPTPINASEDELQKEEVLTAAGRATPKSDPLFEWDDESQIDIRQHELVEEAPLTPQPKMKFRAAPIPSMTPGPDVIPMTKKEKQKGTDTSIIKFESSSSIDMLSRRTIRSNIDDDSRFDVVIIGPDEDNPTQFKLRGKNSVRKVLIAACKNFEVDPNRAYLVHSLDLEVDGEIQTHNFVCAPDDTMAMCGIKSDSKLFVKVNPDTEDDPADDSSE